MNDLSELLGSYGEPWLVTSVCALAAVIAAMIVHAVLSRIFQRVVGLSIVARTMLEFTDRPTRALLPLLALQFVLSAAPPDLRFGTAARNTIALLLIGAMTWLAMRAVAAISEGLARMHPTDQVDNLGARRIQTQARVLSRTAMLLVLSIGTGSALMMFPNVRQIGTSLLASAGIAGLVAGIAARPVLGNLIAGVQIALTQPIRIDDVVIIENEWGRIEEITATYVVVKIWDERRLVVPLQWVIEHPFQNWTRSQSQLLGSVFLWADYGVPLTPLRAELERVCRAATQWDGRVALLQVVDASEQAIQLRALVSAADAPRAWDLRCHVREALIAFLQRQHPNALPRVRAEFGGQAITATPRGRSDPHAASPTRSGD